MKKLMIGLIAAALLPMSVAVQAKTVCLQLFGDPTVMFKLSIPKPLKKPGQFSSITGIYREDSQVAPVEGSAVVNSDGTITLGFHWYSMSFREGDLNWAAKGLDLNLLGTYSYDNNNDAQIDGDTTATAMSCKDFVLPSVI